MPAKIQDHLDVSLGTEFAKRLAIANKVVVFENSGNVSSHLHHNTNQALQNFVTNFEHEDDGSATSLQAVLVASLA
jgi:hypothetical protein